MKSFIIKYWKPLSISLFLILGIVLWARQSAVQKTASSISTTKVKRQDFVKTITSSGKTKADRSVDLKFQTSGRLAWVGVKEGDTVKAYQAIAGLDSREVQKNLEKSLRDYASERNDFIQSGLDSPAIKPEDAANDRLKRILEKNQWDLDKAVLDVELKHIALEYATLISPISGIVTHVDTPVAGINITPATAVFQIVDPQSVVFEAKIDEVDIGTLSIGQEATITLDAYPDETFSGTIVSVSFAAETSTGGATVFPVRIAFKNPDNLRIGFNGDVVIQTQHISDSIVVPLSAIREENKEKFVYRKEQNSYTRTPVVTGPSNDDDTIILSGLTEEDYIVTKGFNTINEN